MIFLNKNMVNYINGVSIFSILVSQLYFCSIKCLKFMIFLFFILVS